MSVIENFAALSVEEQHKFAEDLVKKINTEHTFAASADFVLTGFDANDFDGSFTIYTNVSEPVEVTRKATWQCGSKDEAAEDPGDSADYENFIFDDALNAFKTTSAVIDGYAVTLEVTDADETDDGAIEVTVKNMSEEDSGIGFYEYGDRTEYDSHPYVEVEGTIVRACECFVAFVVEPAAQEPEVEETTEEI